MIKNNFGNISKVCIKLYNKIGINNIATPILILGFKNAIEDANTQTRKNAERTGFNSFIYIFNDFMLYIKLNGNINVKKNCISNPIVIMEEVTPIVIASNIPATRVRGKVENEILFHLI